MSSKTTARVPGEEGDEVVQPKPGTNQLNNIAGQTANDVATDREAIVRAQAMADAARRGRAADLAPPVEVAAPAEPVSLKRRAIINGVEVEVEVPTVRRNSAVEQFGPESKHPKGTPVRKDGTPCEGDEVPYGVIGDINTAQGKLVNRIIPLDSVKAAA